MYKKNVLKIVFLSILVLVLNACSDSNDKNDLAATTQKPSVLKMVLNVEGMTCEGCESAIQNNLSKLPGVVSVKASHVDKTTTVDFDENKISGEAIEKAILETGYKIITAPEGMPMVEEVKVAPKSTMKCGEGKCGHAE